MRSKSSSLLLFVGIFIGVVIALVVTANIEGFISTVTAGRADGAVALGSAEPVSPELAGLQNLSKAFTQVAKIASPAVVTINSQKVIKQRAHPFLNDPFFRRYFQIPEESQERVMRGLGSGVIVNPDGYILTNNHVVTEADEITVTIDKKEYEAKIVGKDPASDVAVIKIDMSNLSTIKLGDSDNLEVGEWVMAIGNPFSNQLQNTVTAGIVSAKGRALGALGGTQLTYQDFIQTDAAINPGNSGGALVNLRGELIGINTAIVGQANVGIGFAIPINLARSVMEQLIDKGRVVRGWLGVMIRSIDEDMANAMGLSSVKGALVENVTKDSPAENAGLKQGDVILKVNDKEIETSDQLTNYIGAIAPDTRVSLIVWRDKKEKSISVKLGERPTDEAAEHEEASEKVTNKLGLTVDALTDEIIEQLELGDIQGIVVSRVESNSVADRKGIERGDVITSVNNKPMRKVSDFNSAIKDLKADDVVLLRLVRGDMTFLRALRVPKDRK